MNEFSGYFEPEFYDELKISQVQTVKTYFPEDEVIYFSGKVKKFNKRLISQERILLITNKAVYNIQPKKGITTRVAFYLFPNLAVKRKINANKIKGVTVSTDPDSNQFILHVTGEYDYRFDGGANCKKIIKSLARVFFLNQTSLFTIILRPESDLKEFETNQRDFKAGRHKTATNEVHQVTQEEIETRLGFLIRKKSIREVKGSNDGSVFPGGNQSHHLDYMDKQSQMTTFDSDQTKDGGKHERNVQVHNGFNPEKHINRLESIPMSFSVEIPKKNEQAKIRNQG